MSRSRVQSLFVSLDGIDGVGKSTQVDRLSKYLRGQKHEVLQVQDPGSTKVGSKLRALLLESDLELHRRTEAMLFMASRCEMIESTIRPALRSGTSVISDRFLLANVVYQSIGGEVSAEQLWQMGRWANNGLQPDLTLLLDMPVDSAIARFEGPADRMERRGPDYLESVRQAFLRELPHSGPSTAVINANRSPEAVWQDVKQAVDELMDKQDKK